MLSQGHFAVDLLSHANARPVRDERKALGLGECAYALIRQVTLLCHGQAVVFARTVIPPASLTGKYRLLSRLGARPLGELLFTDKTMRRGEVEVAEFPVNHQLFRRSELTDAMVGQASIWGRRSLFYLADKPLLVSEFFLPRILDFDVRRDS
jgi:chorismate--pyruvate lyase